MWAKYLRIWLATLAGGEVFEWTSSHLWPFKMPLVKYFDVLTWFPRICPFKLESSLGLTFWTLEFWFCGYMTFWNVKMTILTFCHVWNAILDCRRQDVIIVTYHPIPSSRTLQGLYIWLHPTIENRHSTLHHRKLCTKRWIYLLRLYTSLAN